MPLTRVYAEGFGPFEKLDLDFSDGNGNPHLGPHILCGVNGSGKSTALRVIAWLIGQGGGGFDSAWMEQRIRHSGARLGLVRGRQNGKPFAQVHQFGAKSDREGIGYFDTTLASKFARRITSGEASLDWQWHHYSPIKEEGNRPSFLHQGPIWIQSVNAAYLPRPLLRHETDDGGKKKRFALDRSLAFDAAVDSETVAKWWVNSFSKRALAKEEGDEVAVYNRTIDRLQQFLRDMSGLTLRAGVQHRTQEPYPIVHLRGGAFNFSQLPDGLRATLGWVCDYLSLTEQTELKAPLFEHQGALLIDEIDAHLHPLWQRRLLYALKRTFPNVQIICTTHSPFIINSCRDAIVHLLQVTDDGTAVVQPPIRAPFGKSFAATIREIFGIPTDYDWETEQELQRWQELKRKHAEGNLSPQDEAQLAQLTVALSDRGEELRSLVEPVGNLDVDEIIAMLNKSKAS